TLAVIKAGEMLDFLDTPKNTVVLTELGNCFLDADIDARKKTFNTRLQTLGTFRMVIDVLKESKTHRLPQDIILEELAIRLPTQDPEALFKTVIMWGRFAELFGYSPESEALYLDEPASAPANIPL